MKIIGILLISLIVFPLTAVAKNQYDSCELYWPLAGNAKFKLITTLTYPTGQKHACRYYSGGKHASNTTPYGIDIAVPEGTKVYAPAEGIVQNKFYQPNGFGRHFELLHKDGTITLYAHLSSYEKVENGKKVRKGQLIALTGNTGKSTGPHLHFEMSNNEPCRYYRNRVGLVMSKY